MGIGKNVVELEVKGIWVLGICVVYSHRSNYESVHIYSVLSGDSLLWNKLLGLVTEGCIVLVWSSFS